MTQERIKPIDPRELSRPHNRRINLVEDSAIIVDRDFLLQVVGIEYEEGREVRVSIVSDNSDIIITEKRLSARGFIMKPNLRTGLGNLILTLTRGKNQAVFIATKYKAALVDIAPAKCRLRIDSTNPMDIDFYESTPYGNELKDFFREHIS